MSGRRLDQYGLGLRLAFTGGRDALVRVLLSAVAVGLGVALLLITASIPGMEQHRDARVYSQYDLADGSTTMKAGSRTVLIADTSTVFKGQDIRGRAVHPDGADAPLPPGVGRYPAAGQMVVSPALARLLTADGSQLLRQRLPYPVVGTIGQAGLLGPAQLSYIVGSDGLSFADGAVRIDEYGGPFTRQPLSPLLVLLSLVGFVVMLTPVAVFLGAAARFGGDQRDRRLSALRLSGADRRMTARIAAGESLGGAALGLVLGGLFFLIGRQLLQNVSVEGFSFYAQDIDPQPLIAALVVVVVPVLAIAATQLAMHRVTVDPLGVVRRSGARRRRVWWRVLLPVAGLGVLAVALRSSQGIQQTGSMALAVAGILLLLAGIALLLPWVVEAATRRVPGGGVAWQLAVRRLQLGSGSAAGAVSGIVVAVAGAIALQTLFIGVQASFAPSAQQSAVPVHVQSVRPDVLAEVEFPGADAAQSAQYAAAIRSSPDVRTANGVRDFYLTGTGGTGGVTMLRIADCRTLAAFAPLPDCKDGDSFVALGVHGDDTGLIRSRGALVTTQSMSGNAAAGPDWRISAVTATVRQSDPAADPDGMGGTMLFATPGAVTPALLNSGTSAVFVGLDPTRPDAEDQLRTTAAVISPMSTVSLPGTSDANHNFTSVTHALIAGAAITLLLVAASLLVGQLEQLRDRKRSLAVLFAVGARRRTLALSVLWQSAVPVVLGLLLAVGGGLALGGVLLHLAELPVGYDWSGVAAMVGLGGAAVLLVTLLSLPVLVRIMRPAGLRHE
jgi:hypothetical protein